MEKRKKYIAYGSNLNLEQMARKAENETKKHFGNTVYIFTPIYISKVSSGNGGTKEGSRCSCSYLGDWTGG